MRRALALALTVALGGAAEASGADLDGKHTLVCAPGNASQCDPAALCEQVAAGEIELPDAFFIDFKKKLLHSKDGQRSSPIGAVETNDAALVLQGHQNGRGWSIAIARATGQMTGTITDTEGAFVLSGTCSTASD